MRLWSKDAPAALGRALWRASDSWTAMLLQTYPPSSFRPSSVCATSLKIYYTSPGPTRLCHVTRLQCVMRAIRRACVFFFFAQPHFYFQSFSLTECIVIVRVGKYRGCLSVCLSVCACVCACVCLSVGARTPKLLGRFPWNFPKMISHMSSCVRLSFGSLT